MPEAERSFARPVRPSLRVRRGAWLCAALLAPSVACHPESGTVLPEEPASAVTVVSPRTASPTHESGDGRSASVEGQPLFEWTRLYGSPLGRDWTPVVTDLQLTQRPTRLQVVVTGANEGVVEWTGAPTAAVPAAYSAFSTWLRVRPDGRVEGATPLQTAPTGPFARAQQLTVCDDVREGPVHFGGPFPLGAAGERWEALNLPGRVLCSGDGVLLVADRFVPFPAVIYSPWGTRHTLAAPNDARIVLDLSALFARDVLRHVTLPEGRTPLAALEGGLMLLDGRGRDALIRLDFEGARTYPFAREPSTHERAALAVWKDTDAIYGFVALADGGVLIQGELRENPVHVEARGVRFGQPGFFVAKLDAAGRGLWHARTPDRVTRLAADDASSTVAAITRRKTGDLALSVLDLDSGVPRASARLRASGSHPLSDVGALVRLDGSRVDSAKTQGDDACQTRAVWAVPLRVVGTRRAAMWIAAVTDSNQPCRSETLTSWGEQHDLPDSDTVFHLAGSNWALRVTSSAQYTSGAREPWPPSALPTRLSGIARISLPLRSARAN